MKKEKYLRLTLCLLLIIAMASCSGRVGKKLLGIEGGGPEGRVLATVDGENITEADFLRALARVPAAYREKYLSPEGKRQILRSLVEDELFYREGRRLGIDRTGTVKAEIEDFRKRIVREKISDNLKKDIKVSAGDVKKHYRESPGKYTVPEKLRLSIIMVGLGKDPTPEEVEAAEGKAMDIIDKLNKGEEFEWLARQLSDHSSAGKGGDLGFLPVNEIQPDLAEEASAIPSVGELSDSVRGETGIYIIQLTGKQPEGTVPFDEVRGDIERALLKKARDDAYKKLLDKLEHKGDIELYNSAIDRIGTKRARNGKK